MTEQNIEVLEEQVTDTNSQEESNLGFFIIVFLFIAIFFGVIIMQLLDK